MGNGHVIHSVKLCMLNELHAKIFVESESALSCNILWKVKVLSVANICEKWECSEMQIFVKSESALGCKKKLKVLSVALKLPLFRGLF